VLGILFALGACLSFGISDFVAGVTTRTIANLSVLVVSQVVGLVVIAAIVVAAGDGMPPADFVPYALGAGAVGAIGVGAFWRGLAVGTISIVTPIAAAAALIPTGVALASGERPGAIQLAGMLLVLGGVVLVARAPAQEGETGGRARMAAGAGFGLVAAVCFGSVVILLDEASHAGILWTALVARVGAVVLVVGAALAVRHRVQVPRNRMGTVVAIGVLDLSANVFMAAATTRGYLSIAAVLISLHVVVTIGLARIVLREQLIGIQRVGVLAAVVGAAIVTAA
jgi:drug/metabolite transporter (DMT)-like permease